MASVNKVILIGNLGQAPDVRMTHSNMKVAEISIATTRRFTRNDERVEQTQWHTVTLWGKLAEIVESTRQRAARSTSRAVLKQKNGRIRTAKPDTPPKSLLNRFSYWTECSDRR